jgi:hypothetical protein
MTATATTHTRMARMARRSSASSVDLDLLGHAHHRAHVATEAVI